jgi:predicted enzyme related to lactoylglutathione lyase
MSSPFVWFHHNGNKPNETKTFLESLLSFQASDGPGGMTMLAAGAGPFAALGNKQDRYGDRDEWIPFAAVEDVDAATKRAVALGASLLREKTRGPAGEFTVVRDPGGAAIALWKKA